MPRLFWKVSRSLTERTLPTGQFPLRLAMALPMTVQPVPIAVAAFYRFHRLMDLPGLRSALQELCEAKGVRGILLLAPEGFNGTLAGEPQALDAVLAGIRAHTGAAAFEVKFSSTAKPPFRRLKVRIKKEIVTIGVPSVDPVAVVGTYVEPQDWNALIADPDMLLIDTRNAYEVAIGTFDGALNPETRSFGEFPAYVRNTLDPARHRKVAMFCTGGIRCEKASSFMLAQGFEQVFHLKGGILNYLETVPETESRWSGGCFVFDERVAVGHGLEVQPVRFCLSCNTPLDATALASSGYEDGVSCPACVARLTDQQKASARERQRQVELAAKRGGRHLGPRG